MAEIRIPKTVSDYARQLFQHGSLIQGVDSMKDNLKYMIKNWIEWDKKSLLYFCLRVPAMVFLPIITAFIPKAMIDCINEVVTVGKLTLIVALLSVLVTVTTWLLTRS